ncbi:uncharacterized protein CDAR_451541 [Caerostris darwini]|uniref:Gustatory receptor n=1 Tax=Caerostris darwini TaxID=1538125 RepID=A0AAV4UJK1_9ARAC|nr:uncharacterized protein CDAR_451541 [Caerostris darwini]
MENVVEMILNSTKLFQEIENVLSFSVFLGYVLVFVNFLNLISINVSDFVWPFVNFRIAASVIIFLWTLYNFFKLTLVGTRVIDVCDEWKTMQKNIVKNCTRMRVNNIDDVTYLLMVMEVTKIDIAFTGWGMFQLDRKLLLTMMEAIISYSVLIATL